MGGSSKEQKQQTQTASTGALFPLRRLSLLQLLLLLLKIGEKPAASIAADGPPFACGVYTQLRGFAGVVCYGRSPPVLKKVFKK